jgi:hypothetical protein
MCGRRCGSALRSTRRGGFGARNVAVGTGERARSRGGRGARRRRRRAQTRPGGESRAILLSLRTEGTRGSTSTGDGDQPSSLEELARLADTDGLTVVGQLTQARGHPDPATYLGSGKVEELARLAAEADADVVIADGELSPAQVRNLEDRTGVRVVDRTALILDIFAEHARSHEGKAQVELAQLAYQHAAPCLSTHDVVTPAGRPPEAATRVENTAIPPLNE